MMSHETNGRGCRESVDPGAIHDLIPDEKGLGRHYNPREKLLARPRLRGYVPWKRKKGRTKPKRRRKDSASKLAYDALAALRLTSTSE